MKKSKIQELTEKSVTEMMDEQYLEADNTEELNYWAPISDIILESIELRNEKGLSQTELAKKMKTRQSVISRFENMGRVPSYDLIARLSYALDNKPGITLYGDYMVVVSPEKQYFIKELANRENIPIRKFVQNLLNQSIDNITLTSTESKVSDKTPIICGTVISANLFELLHVNEPPFPSIQDSNSTPQNVIDFSKAS